VYPTAFIILAGLFTRRSMRSRIGIVLGATALVSYALSIAFDLDKGRSGCRPPDE
jgi:hypothetical protein